MADQQRRESDDSPTTANEQARLAVEDSEQAEQTPERLELEVTIDERGACQRHITVRIPEADIRRYFDKQFSELMPTAQVPGFRPGRAPRKLVEARFRKEVAERVKSELLLDSVQQLHEERDLSPISEPEIDLDAVEMPAQGPLTFEFDLEVRPEFELPEWKGLVVEKPVHEFTQEDIDRALKNVLANRGRLAPSEDPAQAGDYVSVNLTFRDGETVLSSAREEVIRIRPVLSFRDGKIEQFDELMAGVRPGDIRHGEAQLTDEAPNVALRGKRIAAEFEVLEVKRLEVPQLDEQLLDELGGFESEAELRDAIKDQLDRQLEYEQHRRARQQITAALTVAANWELPPELLKRQSRRELDRAVLELRRSGFSEEEIRAHENQLRQNSLTATARALKEHFILERIAEEEGIEVSETDYDHEIALIALQAEESPRRVRARLEKSGQMDALRNQIIERKVIQLILEHAQFKEVPYDPGQTEAAAIDQAAGGQGTEIPEAKPEAGTASEGGMPQQRPIRE